MQKNIARPYQKEAIKQLSEAFKNGYRHIMLMLATGAGKTTIASDIIKTNVDKNPNFKAMFICDRIELINQTSIRFKNDGIDHGVIQADHALTDYTKNIQICSIQTLARFEKNKTYNYEQQKSKIMLTYTKPSIIFIDEAHTLYTEHKLIMELWPDVAIVGLSATPFPKGLGKYFKKLVVGATTRQLQELGYLVKTKVFAPTQIDFNELKDIKESKGDYDENELAKIVNKPKIIGDIVEHYIKITYNKSAICFAVNIAHSKAIKDEFWKANIHAEHIDAYTKDTERKQIIEDFRNGKIKVLVCVDILTKGFDYPGAEVCILARPTKSKSVYIQQVGRVLRISPETGKVFATILDHACNTQVHGFCDEEMEYELDGLEIKKNKTEYKRIEKKNEVTICPSCFFAKESFVCENCNYEFKPINKVVSKDGKLVELEKEEIFDVIIEKKNAKNLFTKDLDLLYAELLELCRIKKWKEGRAFFLFNDITNEKINKEIQDQARFIKIKDIRKETYNMITYLNIKKAKSKNYIKKT